MFIDVYCVFIVVSPIFIDFTAPNGRQGRSILLDFSRSWSILVDVWIDYGSILDRVGIAFVSILDRFWITFGLILDRFGTDLGSVWNRFWIDMGVNN